jgi:hypothetical protein
VDRGEKQLIGLWHWRVRAVPDCPICGA